jgi:hypothetical protein
VGKLSTTVWERFGEIWMGIEILKVITNIREGILPFSLSQKLEK